MKERRCPREHESGRRPGTDRSPPIRQFRASGASWPASDPLPTAARDSGMERPQRRPKSHSIAVCAWLLAPRSSHADRASRGRPRYRHRTPPATPRYAPRATAFDCRRASASTIASTTAAAGVGYRYATEGVAGACSARANGRGPFGDEAAAHGRSAGERPLARRLQAVTRAEDVLGRRSNSAPAAELGTKGIVRLASAA